MENQRLKKLARRIDSLPSRDSLLAQRTSEITAMRRAAAAELHRICADLIGEINGLLSSVVIDLSPEQYSADLFQDEKINLMQVNLRGRLLQIEFRSPDTLISSEDFRVPYILQGAVRSFNQDYLEREAIEEQYLYYCLERQNSWRFFDARTYRTGLFDADYLMSLMERLI